MSLDKAKMSTYKDVDIEITETFTNDDPATPDWTTVLTFHCDLLSLQVNDSGVSKSTETDGCGDQISSIENYGEWTLDLTAFWYVSGTPANDLQTLLHSYRWGSDQGNNLAVRWFHQGSATALADFTWVSGPVNNYTPAGKVSGQSGQLTCNIGGESQGVGNLA